MNSWQLDVQAEVGQFKLSVSLNCRARVLGLFGPSGSGKSTLVERFASVQPFIGDILIGGRSVRELRVGWVPQEGALFPHLTVAENIDYSRMLGSVRDRAVEVLGIEGLLERGVAGLSGGESQRVSLARALASEPDILILDEPLSGVDLPRRANVFRFLLDVLHEFELPMVYVSHDPAEMLAVVDHVLCLEAGRVVEHGSPDKVLTIPAPSHWLSS